MKYYVLGLLLDYIVFPITTSTKKYEVIYYPNE